MAEHNSPRTTQQRKKMPLTKKRSPEQWAALIEEVKQRSAKRKRETRIKAKQQRDALIEVAMRKSRRESRRRLLKKLKWLNETVRSGRYTG
jgi:hypothetical protein